MKLPYCRVSWLQVPTLAVIFVAITLISAPTAFAQAQTPPYQALVKLGPIPAAAQFDSTGHLDVDAATRAYLDTISPDKRADQLVTEPASEGLVGLVVDVLPIETDIDIPWKTEDCSRQHELGEVDPRLQPLETNEPAGEVAHAPGDASEEQE